VIWFLREIAPRAEASGQDRRNVDAGVRSRDGALFEHYKDWFLGRVENPGAIYASARLPCFRRSTATACRSRP